MVCYFTAPSFIRYHLIPQHFLTRLIYLILPEDLKCWGCFVWLKISLISFLRRAACYQQCECFTAWRRAVRKRRDYFYTGGKRAMWQCSTRHLNLDISELGEAVTAHQIWKKYSKLCRLHTPRTRENNQCMKFIAKWHFYLNKCDYYMIYLFVIHT